MAGDYNFVEDVNLDIIDAQNGTNLQPSLQCGDFHHAVQRLNLTDAFRYLYPSRREGTAKSTNSNRKSRLDRFYVDGELLTKISKVQHISWDMSDHKIVVLNVQQNFCEGQTGPGYWKFNTLLLQNQEFINSMNTLIAVYKQAIENCRDPAQKLAYWEGFKVEARIISNRKANKQQQCAERKLIH